MGETTSPDSLYEVVFSSERPLQRCAVHAAVRRSHNRQQNVHTDITAIDKTWETLCAQHNDSSSLYNGLKFRLHSAVLSGNECRLELGITDYRASVGTTRHVDAYAALALSVGAASPDVFLANALGVECLTRTSDGHFVFFRRSDAVAEYAGHYCCPGGHAEPSYVLDVQRFATKCGFSPRDLGGALVEKVADWFESVNSAILVESLFDAAAMEVADELGVSRAACHNAGLLGVVQNTATRKPDACFYVQVQLTAAEVERCFDARRGADAFESVSGSLRLVDAQNVSAAADVSRVVAEKLDGKLTPPSLACLVLGRGMVVA